MVTSVFHANRPQMPDQTNSMIHRNLKESVREVGPAGRARAKGDVARSGVPRGPQRLLPSLQPSPAAETHARFRIATCGSAGAAKFSLTGVIGALGGIRTHTGRVLSPSLKPIAG